MVGALIQGDQGIRGRADHRAVSNDSGLHRIGRTPGIDDRGAVVRLNVHLNLIGALLHRVPGEAVGGTVILDHLSRAARRRDTELVDGRRAVSAGRCRPGDRRSDQRTGGCAGRQGDRQEPSILKALASRAVPPVATQCCVLSDNPISRARQQLPHRQESSRELTRGVFRDRTLQGLGDEACGKEANSQTSQVQEVPHRSAKKQHS